MSHVGHGIILDRSVWSDWVFASNSRQDGTITEEGYQLYMRLRKRLLDSLPIPHVTLYLEVDPQTCYDRIHHMRQRGCEDGIPLAYLEGLDREYRNFLTHMESKGSSVVTINWNNFGTVAAVAEQIIATPALTHQQWVSPSTVESMLTYLNCETALKEALSLDDDTPFLDVITRHDSPLSANDTFEELMPSSLKKVTAMDVSDICSPSISVSL